jgi:hypothetical protein
MGMFWTTTSRQYVGPAEPVKYVPPPGGTGVVKANDRPRTKVEHQMFRLWDSGEGKDNRGDLNKLLADGWVPVRETALHPTENSGVMFAALILLRREVPA